MKKSSAVGWLEERLREYNILTSRDYELIKYAKQMEEQQIVDAYLESPFSEKTIQEAKQYYDQTYKQDESKTN